MFHRLRTSCRTGGWFTGERHRNVCAASRCAACFWSFRSAWLPGREPTSSTARLPSSASETASTPRPQTPSFTSPFTSASTQVRLTVCACNHGIRLTLTSPQVSPRPPWSLGLSRVYSSSTVWWNRPRIFTTTCSTPSFALTFTSLTSTQSVSLPTAKTTNITKYFSLVLVQITYYTWNKTK